jgi:hypothetical protein
VNGVSLVHLIRPADVHADRQIRANAIGEYQHLKIRLPVRHRVLQQKLLVQPLRAVERLHKKFLLEDILFSAQALDPPLVLSDNINQQRLPRCPVLFLLWA